MQRWRVSDGVTSEWVEASSPTEALEILFDPHDYDWGDHARLSREECLALPVLHDDIATVYDRLGRAVLSAPVRAYCPHARS